MGLMLSGPRRVYVLVLFAQRIDTGFNGSSFDTHMDRGRHVRLAGTREAASAVCRLAVALRLQRVFWGRLVGASFLVLDAGVAPR